MAMAWVLWLFPFLCLTLLAWLKLNLRARCCSYWQDQIYPHTLSDTVNITDESDDVTYITWRRVGTQSHSQLTQVVSMHGLATASLAVDPDKSSNNKGLALQCANNSVRYHSRRRDAACYVVWRVAKHLTQWTHILSNHPARAAIVERHRSAYFGSGASDPKRHAGVMDTVTWLQLMHT